MRRTIVVLAVALFMLLALAVPALAATTGAGGAGQAFGEHHATHAQDMGGFTGEMNPGVMHEGFWGWAEHTEP